VLIEPWPLVSSERVADVGLFQVTRDRARSPRSGQEWDYHVVHMQDWLLMVPLTRDGRLVMVRQFRHGSRRIGLEVPGGRWDAGEQPQEGALRELLEETGFSGGPVADLGALWPQPAFLANRVHIFLAAGLERAQTPQPEPDEEIEVVLIAPGEIDLLIAAGEIHSAMTVTALALARASGHI